MYFNLNAKFFVYKLKKKVTIKLANFYLQVKLGYSIGFNDKLLPDAVIFNAELLTIHLQHI